MGLKVWPTTAPPRSEEARTRTAPSSNAGARTAPQTSIFRPAPALHRTRMQARIKARNNYVHFIVGPIYKDIGVRG